MTASPPFLSIHEAAERLGVKPWDVVRLIRSGDLVSVELVDVESLSRYEQEARR